MTDKPQLSAAEDFAGWMHARDFGTILADPPWQFSNRTGKVAPEHRRLSRYPTLALAEITAIPVASVAAAKSHLYLWVPNALLAEGLTVMQAWGFSYKTNIVWHKIRKDGGPDGRGGGFYMREHSRKPDELYTIIEACSPAPYLELFARGTRPHWMQWGNQVEDYEPDWATYANHSQATPKS